jgi:hypothetical protein
MAAEFEVEGGKELRRSLKQVEDGLKDLKAVHAEVGGIVADEARATAPTLTGALAGSVRPGATLRGAVIRAGGARVPYAGVIHWGWPRRNIVGQPFMTSAASDTEPTWLARYEARIDELLAKVKGA